MLGFAKKTVVRQSVPADERSFSHCCCEKGNLLFNPVDNTKMNIVDASKEHDFADPKTVDSIIRRLKGLGDVCFYCTPCSGGSTWQRLNIKLATKT